MRIVQIFQAFQTNNEECPIFDYDVALDKYEQFYGEFITIFKFGEIVISFSIDVEPIENLEILVRAKNEFIGIYSEYESLFTLHIEPLPVLEEEEVIEEESKEDYGDSENEQSPTEVESIVPNFFAEWLALQEALAA